VNLVAGLDEVTAHAHEETVKDIHRLLAGNGVNQTAVEAAPEFDELARLLGLGCWRVSTFVNIIQRIKMQCSKRLSDYRSATSVLNFQIMGVLVVRSGGLRRSRPLS
jgi:hypothetical protein